MTSDRCEAVYAHLECAKLILSKFALIYSKFNILIATNFIYYENLPIL